MFEAIALSALIFAAVPALMTVLNLVLYRPLKRPPEGEDPDRAWISVLIPARNEEATIAGAVESALSSRGVELEVVVMDDGSEDATAEIVRDIARRDPRVRLERAPLLRPGWCGKPHACAALARAASYSWLLFVDADVRLSPDTLRSMHASMRRTGVALLSGVPRQETESLFEKALIPLIHFVLLGFLPMLGLRLTRLPAFAAGCGQLVMVRREPYENSGGHAVIRASRHDGITLPRALRRAGFATDLFDATASARCRMYHGFGEVWNGLAKNATEGMAAPAAILPWSLLLLGGQVLPWALLIVGLPNPQGATGMGYAVSALALSLATRFLLTFRFGQSLSGAWLHPVGVLLLVGIQWYALAVKLSGRSIAWRGRVPTASADLSSSGSK